MADTYSVERSMQIDAAPAEVFERLADYRAWMEWSPWEEMDPSMARSFTGQPGSVGAGYHWSGNRKVGEGRMTTTSLDSPRHLEIALEFVKPFRSESQTTFVVEPRDGGSHVTWRMSGRHNWMSKIVGIFKSMDSMVGPDFERGLANLKRASES